MASLAFSIRWLLKKKVLLLLLPPLLPELVLLPYLIQLVLEEILAKIIFRCYVRNQNVLPLYRGYVWRHVKCLHSPSLHSQSDLMRERGNYFVTVIISIHVFLWIHLIRELRDTKSESISLADAPSSFPYYFYFFWHMKIRILFLSSFYFSVMFLMINASTEPCFTFRAVVLHLDVQVAVRWCTWPSSFFSVNMSSLGLQNLVIHYENL